MNPLFLVVYQLLFYGPLAWLAFAGIAYGCARSWGWAGMFAGHCVVAVLVVLLDLAWLREAMAAPGWDGTPDMDLIFHTGCVVRIVMINTILLIATFWGLRACRRRRMQEKEPAQAAA